MLRNIINRVKNPKVWVFLQSVFIMTWLTNLSGTDSLYSVYALCGIACIFCLCDNVRNRRFRPEQRFISVILLSFMFSLVVFVANYPRFTVVWYMDSLYYSTNIIKNGLNAICSLIGGFFVAYEIILYILFHFPIQTEIRLDTMKSRRVFWITFASVLVVDLVYLVLDEFPGHITPDALYQITQGYTNSFINDHPFWNTLYIKGVLSLGYFLFGSANGAMALYSIIQILMMAFCFAYAVMTLYQGGVPKWLLAVFYVLFVLMPYNIAYSVTMSKDVPYSLSFLLLCVSFYRLMCKLPGRNFWNYAVMALGVAGICLSRTNGLALALISCVFCLPYLFRHHRKLLLILVCVILLAGILTGPVISGLGIASADAPEVLSLPLQQMARVVYEGHGLTESQRALLGRIFDLDEIQDIYVQWYADPIKIEVRENDCAYFSAHLQEYLKLWVELGLEHPVTYLKAWVEQTKGYWNGGYSYFQYVEMMQENTYGFAKTAGNNIFAKLIDVYFGITRQSMFFEPINSIGLLVWIVALCCFLNVRWKRPVYLLSVPLLAIIALLLLGTPVYAEFRYAYPIFMAYPLVISATAFESHE